MNWETYSASVTHNTGLNICRHAETQKHLTTKSLKNYRRKNNSYYKYSTVVRNKHCYCFNTLYPYCIAINSLLPTDQPITVVKSAYNGKGGYLLLCYVVVSTLHLCKAELCVHIIVTKVHCHVIISDLHNVH